MMPRSKKPVKSQEVLSTGFLCLFFCGASSLIGARVLALVLGELQKDLLQRRLADRVVLHIQLVAIALHQAKDARPFHPSQWNVERQNALVLLPFK